jgi:antirestriction protein
MTEQEALSYIKSNLSTAEGQEAWAKISESVDLLHLIAEFSSVNEESKTPYKNDYAYYSKRAHYVNGRKVNRRVYARVRKYLRDRLSDSDNISLFK